MRAKLELGASRVQGCLDDFSFVCEEWISKECQPSIETSIPYTTQKYLWAIYTNRWLHSAFSKTFPHFAISFVFEKHLSSILTYGNSFIPSQGESQISTPFCGVLHWKDAGGIRRSDPSRLPIQKMFFFGNSNRSFWLRAVAYLSLRPPPDVMGSEVLIKLCDKRSIIKCVYFRNLFKTVEVSLENPATNKEDD